MGLSINTYPYNGGSQVFPVNFALGFLNREDVDVYVEGDFDSTGEQIYKNFTWNNDSEIVVTDPLTTGDNVAITRTVSKENLVVDFNTEGSATRRNIQFALQQAMMALHEMLDGRIEPLETVYPFDTYIETITNRYEDFLGLSEQADIDALTATQQAQIAQEQAVIATAAANAADEDQTDSLEILQQVTTALTAAQTQATAALDAASQVNSDKIEVQSNISAVNVRIDEVNQAIDDFDGSSPTIVPSGVDNAGKVISVSGTGNVIASPQPWINAEAFGFEAGKTGTQNHAALEDAKAAAIALGTNRILLPSTGGDFADVDPFSLPDFVTNDSDQTMARSFHIHGMGQMETKIRATSSAPYGIFGHPSHGRLSNRGQNSLGSIKNMWLEGLGDYTDSSPVIGLSNAWAWVLEDLIVGGTPRAGAISLFSFSRGGCQSNYINRVRSTKRRHWSIQGSRQLYSLDALRKDVMGSLVELIGPHDGIGKCNNNIVNDCEIYTALKNVVDIKSFLIDVNHDRSSKLFPGGGGADWTRIMNTFAGAEGTTKLEIAEFHEVSGPTSFILSTNTTDYITTNPNQYTDCVLKVEDPATGYEHGRRITGFNTVTRQCIIESPFPFTVPDEAEYIVKYAHADWWDEGYHPTVPFHLLRFDSSVYTADVKDCRVEEGTAVAYMDYASNNVNIEGNQLWSDQSKGFPVYNTDASKPFADTVAPDFYSGRQPRGETGFNANIIANTVAATTYVTSLNNATSNPVETEYIVRMSGNTVDAVNSINYTSSSINTVTHAISHIPNGLSAEIGENIGVATAGKVRVNILFVTGEAGQVGDIVVPLAPLTSGGILTDQGVGKVISKSDPDFASLRDNAVGVLTQNYTHNTARALVKLQVRVLPPKGLS